MVHVRQILAGDPPAPTGAPAPTFGHSGWLWHNAYLLYDRETNSLWHHLTGRALSGPLRGASLRRLPTSHTTFAAWRTEHPDTLVLPHGAATPREDPYGPRDRSLTFGYGVDLGDRSHLYPMEALAGGPLEDTLAGVPLVVVRTGPRSAHAFDRRVDGDTVSFRADTRDGRPVLRDRDGDRAWWARTGRPVAGTAPPLRPLPGSLWEAAAWSLQHPRGTAGRSAAAARPPR